MQETIDLIIERSSFENKDKLNSFLQKCIKISNDTSKSTYAIHDNVLFQIDTFFLELAKMLNSTPKGKRFLIGVELLEIVLQELGIDIEKEDAFVLYHLRDLGKFRMRDGKLKDELTILWKQYKDYALCDQDFAHCLKYLMRSGLIEYRKRNLSLNTSLIIRYKN